MIYTHNFIYFLSLLSGPNGRTPRCGEHRDGHGRPDSDGPQLRRPPPLPGAAEPLQGENQQGGRLVPIQHHGRKPISSSGCHRQGASATHHTTPVKGKSSCNKIESNLIKGSENRGS